MNAIYENIAISSLIAIGLGVGATSIVVDSDNGYVAGFVFFPLLILICIASFISFIVALFTLATKSKIWIGFLLFAFLLPTSFFTASITAKHFELGAYRQEPMIPIIEETSNIIIFKKDVTRDQVSEFWNTVMSTERSDGRGFTTIPGVGTMGSLRTRNGNDTMTFSFFPNATEEQKQFVFSTVKDSSIVEQVLENQSVKEFDKNSDDSKTDSNSDNTNKKAVIINSTNSN